MKCNQCGADNSEEFRFCGACGTPLSKPVVRERVDGSKTQQWEYCALVGISKHHHELDAFHPSLWHFTEKGVAVTEIEGTEQDGIARTVAELGNKGWEVVGFANLTERVPASWMGMAVYGSGALLFKRPKQSV